MAARGETARENVCPRCGEQADWTYADADRQQVTINCRVCGSFGMTRQECREALDELEAEDDETRTPG